MKRFAIVFAFTLVCGIGTARAQTPPPAEHGYAEFAFGAGFGNVTSGVFGGEIGARVTQMFDVFVEGGRIRDTAMSDLISSAQIVNSYLSRFGTATYAAKQPTTYFDAGVRATFAVNEYMKPYVAVGIGGAKVEKKVSFSVNGSDVTGSLLPAFGVQLGSDLTGSETKAMFMFGVGARIPIMGRLIGDVSYRYGRIFLQDEGMNTNRLQFGVGAKF